MSDITINSTYSISESNVPSMSSNLTFVNEYIAYVDDDVNITTNTIYAPIHNPPPGFTGTHGPYILSGLSGSNGPSAYVNYNITTGYSGYQPYIIPGNIGLGTDLFLSNNMGHYLAYDYKSGPYCNDTIIKNIKHIGSKNIPVNSMDIITYEEINDGDILIDFNRDLNKTEYDYNAFYKESTLIEILKNKKNQFTMKDIDISSIVKYTAEIK